METVDFDDDNNIDSPKIREMAKELHNIKVKRLEKEKISHLDDEIHAEKTKLKYREIIDKIPKPVQRGAKWVGRAAKGVASGISKIESQPAPKISSKNKRQIRSIDRSSPSINRLATGLSNFSNSLGGVASSQPRGSSKPHNILGMTNNFSNSLNRDLLNGQPPIKKKPHRTQQKTPRQKYLDLAQQEFNLLNSKNDPHRFRRKEIIRDYSRSTRKIKNVNRVMNR